MACLLCVSKKRDLIEIYSEKGKTLTMASVLTKHFWFELSPEDRTIKAVCKQCWKKTLDFHLFYMEVEESQPLMQQQDLEAKHEMEEDDIKDETILVVEEVMPVITEIPERTIVVEDIKYEAYSEVEDNSFEPMDDSDDDDDDDEELEEEEDEFFEPKEKIKQPRHKDAPTKRKRPRKESKSTNHEMTKKQQERFLKNNDEQHKIMEYCKMMCDLCTVSFRDWSDVKNHYRQKHKVKGYVFCTCCNEKFSRRFRILDHIEFKANPEAFKCEICDKNYEHRDSLQNHMHTHKPAEERLFKCDKCDKSYAKKGLLGAHIRTRHISDEDKKFVCGECGGRFATQAILNSHVRGVHEGAYIHVCEICAKVFKSKMFFEKHKLNIHSISPPPKVQCQNCGNWLRESSMRSHIHSCQQRQEKGLHICNICGKESPNSRALQSHKRFVHLAQKLYQCSVCDKAFKRAITLKEHSTIHSGEVLYCCTFCPKTFNSNANMHAHRKKIHKAQWEQMRAK